MKKTLLILAVLLLLAGCASDKNHYSYLSNGDDVLLSGPDNFKLTYNDFYKQLKEGSEEAIKDDMLIRIAQKYELDMEALEQNAQEFIDLYTSLGYESYLVSYYGSLDAAKEMYKNSLIISELSQIYVKENYDAMVAEDAPVQMQLASFDNLEDAQACIDDVGNGSTFDMAAANHNSLNTPSVSVYTDSDASLSYEIKEYLNSTDKTGISTIITTTTSETDADGNAVDKETYYVVNVESRNPDDFKEDYIKLAAANTSTETVNDFFLKNHKISFFDQDLYKMMTEAYEVLK